MRITEAALCAELFPAYAGVIPGLCARWWPHMTFPRIRGGDPRDRLCGIIDTIFSPHTRG